MISFETAEEKLSSTLITITNSYFGIWIQSRFLRCVIFRYALKCRNEFISKSLQTFSETLRGKFLHCKSFGAFIAHRNLRWFEFHYYGTIKHWAREVYNSSSQICECFHVAGKTFHIKIKHFLRLTTKTIKITFCSASNWRCNKLYGERISTHVTNIRAWRHKLKVISLKCGAHYVKQLICRRTSWSRVD